MELQQPHSIFARNVVQYCFATSKLQTKKRILINGYFSLMSWDTHLPTISLKHIHNRKANVLNNTLHFSGKFKGQVYTQSP